MDIAIEGEQMKLEKAVAYAEIVSSIAIALTLLYLAVQTQNLTEQTEQTNRALNANSREATMMADVNRLTSIAAYPE